MNWKVVTAFSTGAVLASGIVYFAVRTPDPDKPAVIQAVTPKVVPAKPAVVLRTARPPADVVRIPPRHVPIPFREKPSPMPPPLRRQEDVVIARNEPSPQPVPVAQAPVPTPAPAQNAPVQNVTVENISLPASEAETRVPHTVTLTPGTLLAVRIGETLSSSRNQAGDSFLATLTQPLVIDGFVIAERGARVEGRVVDTAQAGRVTGASHLGISIVRLSTADGQNVRIRTEPYVKEAPTSNGSDVAKIGGGAAIGAVLGAVAGGGKGAAIGAGVGGVAGAGDVLLTRGKPAEIPVETRVSFRVQDSISITERLD